MVALVALARLRQPMYSPVSQRPLRRPKVCLDPVEIRLSKKFEFGSFLKEKGYIRIMNEQGITFEQLQNENAPAAQEFLETFAMNDPTAPIEVIDFVKRENNSTIVYAFFDFEGNEFIWDQNILQWEPNEDQEF
jgi:hypothetical protein